MRKERWEKKYEDKRNWREQREGVGAPYVFHECLKVFLAYLHVLLNTNYRGRNGFLRGLSRLISFDVPDYTTICRRVNKIAIEIKKTLISYKDKEVVVYLDSSGAKVTNRGEWMRQKWKVRRGWIKVHIAVDDKNKQVVGIEATDESISDTKEFKNLVGQSVENVEDKGGEVVQASADGAYDANDNFEFLEAHNIIPAIKIRKNEGPTYRSKNPRKGYAREFRELGYEGWRDKYKYGRRWYAESTFSAVKRKFGEFVRATKVKNMFNEIKLKYILYNAILKYDVTHTPFFASLV